MPTATLNGRRRTKTKRFSRTRALTRPRSTKRRRMSPDDLLRLVLIAQPQISPDGSQVVFTRKHVGEKNEYISNLWIASTSGSDPGDSGGPGARQFTAGERDASPRWSPDGTKIAFIGARDKHKPQLYVISSSGGAGGEATALTSFPEGKIGSFKWSPDGRHIAVAFRAQDPEWTQDAQKEREEHNLSTPARVLDDWWYRLDGDGYFGSQRFQLHLVDVRAGQHKPIWTKDTFGHFDFDFSPDSRQLVIATNRDPKAMIQPWKDKLVILNLATGKTRELPGVPEGPKVRVAWSPNGKSIAYAGRTGKTSGYDTANLELFVCDANKGRARSPGFRSLTGHTDYCLMAAALSDTAEVDFAPAFQWSPDSKRIFLRLGWQGEVHIASVDAAAKRPKPTLHTRGTLDHWMGNLSEDGKAMAMTIASPQRPPEVYVGAITASGVKTKPLTDFNGRFLEQFELAIPESTWVKARDGAKTQVWLMKPPGFKRNKKYPGVLEIHGGPHAQYGVGFFHEMQVLAAAGYVVVFSNPRGSKGYGRRHCEAIRGCWGTADWLDIQAVTAFMKKHRAIDSKRMGVMGGSYGGFMTNWAIGHTCDFAAAITDRCVSNLVSMSGTSDYTDLPGYYWPGNAWDQPEKMWEHSPLKYLGECETPTLIIHSEGDLRCNIEQAEQVFTALKLNDVPTRFVRYPASTSHGLSRSGPPDLRIHRLEQILGWWKRWLR